MDISQVSAAAAVDLKKLLPSEEQLPKLRRPVADSFHTAPGYREMGHFYTCVPDAVYPWDPVVLKRIWEFAPDAVPMWVQWVFVSPADTGHPVVTVFGRHALGRKLWYPTSEILPLKVTMPMLPCQGVSFEKPNQLWFIHEGERDREGKYKDLPGRYLPFDDSILARARDSAIGFKMTEREFVDFMKEEYIEKPRRAAERRKAALQDDMDYRERDLQRYAEKQLERVSDVEAEEFRRSVGKRERNRKPTILVP